MTKKEKQIINILIKSVNNMQTQMNVLMDVLTIDLKDEQMKTYNNKIVDIDKSTYDRMCEMMETKEIPFMGIA